MVQAIQVTAYKAFDGQTFATAKEARAHEEAHGPTSLVGLTLPQIEAAMKREDKDLADAIEFVGTKIFEKRRADGELRRRPKGSGEAGAAGVPEAP